MNECQRCGACCARYRVSFYWAEAWSRGLPDRLVDKVNPQMACMAGTNQPDPRCLALEGRVGGQVHCAVYEQRPEPCRQVEPGDERCMEARRRHGLPPLPLVCP
jgi:Fe-S-cluster containining protein